MAISRRKIAQRTKRPALRRKLRKTPEPESLDKAEVEAHVLAALYEHHQTVYQWGNPPEMDANSIALQIRRGAKFGTAWREFAREDATNALRRLERKGLVHGWKARGKIPRGERGHGFPVERMYWSLTREGSDRMKAAEGR